MISIGYGLLTSPCGLEACLAKESFKGVNKIEPPPHFLLSCNPFLPLFCFFFVHFFVFLLLLGLLWGLKVDYLASFPVPVQEARVM